MRNAKKQQRSESNPIALNKKYRYDFILGERNEAGLMLEGWEVQSLRSGRIPLPGS